MVHALILTIAAGSWKPSPGLLRRLARPRRAIATTSGRQLRSTASAVGHSSHGAGTGRRLVVVDLRMDVEPTSSIGMQLVTDNCRLRVGDVASEPQT
jgi:hypothetical protein